MPKPTLILASVSIGRRQLLEKLGVPFFVLPSTINEDIITHQNPFKMVQLRARAKAEDVVEKLTSQHHPEAKSAEGSPRRKVQTLINSRADKTMNYLVIAADSMAVLDGKAYGKAKNKADAKRIVSEIMGKTHEFATATCVISLKSSKSPKSLKESQRWENIFRTAVTFRKLPETELTEYVTRYDLTRFAAGYTLGETPWDIVVKIDGSYTNVIGLPFEVILPLLRRFQLL